MTRRAAAPPPTLHLVGLGAGAAELLTLRSWELLASGKPLRIRDPAHEAAQTVLARGFDFDCVTDVDPDDIARSLVAWARHSSSCVYAMPGHPLEAPETVAILRQAERAGVRVSVEPSITDLERLPAADPLTGTLAGPEALRGAIAFARLIAVMARLRAPGGCPWDFEQTHVSLAIHLLEETHEVLDAIDRDHLVDLEEELGDLLLQVVFHAEIASGEDGGFEIADVVEELIAKLVYRHPHVFGDLSVTESSEVVANWEALKTQAKPHPPNSTRADGIPKGLPALLYAHKAQRRLAGAGEHYTGSADRLAALARGVPTHLSAGADEAFGDLLFEVVALAKEAGVDPEGALRRTASRHLMGSVPERAEGPVG